MEFDHSTDTIAPDDQSFITIGGTAGIKIPSGTTAQRPSGEAGVLRLNTETGAVEIAVGSSFRSIDTTSGAVYESVTALGTTQGTAAPVTAAFVDVTSSSGALRGIILPTPTIGQRITIINRSANAIRVFPGVGHTIGALGANAPITLVVGSGNYEFVASSSTAWQIANNVVIAGTSVANYIVTVDPANEGLQYRELAAGSGVTITPSAGALTIAASGGSGTVTSVAATAPAAGFTISGSPITNSGTLTFALANDLAAVESLSTTGIVRRTAADTWTAGTAVGLTTEVTGILPAANGGTGVNNSTRTLTINTNSGTLVFTNAATTLTIANTGSVSGTNTGDQTITLTGDVTGSGTGSFAATLATVNSAPQTDTFRRVTVNGKGLVTATSAVTSGDITTALGYTPYNATNPSGYTSNTGTVTSVGVSSSGTYSAALTVGSSPVTGSGTITITPNLFSTSTAGIVPASGGGTTNFLRADGTWAAAGGGGGTPGGANTQIQYNSAGTFAGDADFVWNETTNTLTLGGVNTGIVLAGVTTEPATPAAGTGRLYSKLIANRMMPKWIGPSGYDYPLQASLGHNRIQLWQAGGGSTTITALGATALTTAGTVTAKTTAVTNIYTAIQATEWLVTAATTTAVASFRHATAQYRVGTNSASLPGGFYFSCRWGPATGVATTTHRAFCGMGSSAAPTDVQPSTLTNSVGMGWDSADANIQIIHNAATTATKINLGASFPVPTTDRTKMYELVLFSPMSTTQTVGYRVTDLGTGAQVSGLITTNMPSTTTYMAPRAYCSVGGTSSVVGIALSSLYIETDF